MLKKDTKRAMSSSLWRHNNKTYQPHARNSALRASMNGRSGFSWFLSQRWFQADVRPARVMRDVGRAVWVSRSPVIVQGERLASTTCYLRTSGSQTFHDHTTTACRVNSPRTLPAISTVLVIRSPR